MKIPEMRFETHHQFRTAYLDGLGALMRFRCPKCSGSDFGSSGRYPNTKRACHGSDANLACGFTWNARHDYLYFTMRQ